MTDRTAATLPAEDLNRVCIAFAAFADLHATHLVDHSMRVAHLATLPPPCSGSRAHRREWLPAARAAASFA